MINEILSKTISIGYHGCHYKLWFNYHYSFVQLTYTRSCIKIPNEYDIISLLLSALINFNCCTPIKIFRYGAHTILKRNELLFETSCNTDWGSFIIVNSKDFVAVRDLTSVQLLVDWCVEFYGNEPRIIPRSHFKICGGSSDE